MSVVDVVAQLAGAIKPSPKGKSPVVERRQGTVTDVDPATGTCTVSIAGDPQEVPNVKSDSNYVPQADDTVWVEVRDKDLTVVGKVGHGPSVNAGIRVSSVAPAEFRADTVYGDLLTAGPAAQVTVTDSGLLKVSFSCLIATTSANDGGSVACALSGTNTVAPNDAKALSFLPLVDGAQMLATRVTVFDGLEPGLTTVTMKYRDLVDTGSDVSYGLRELIVEPL